MSSAFASLVLVACHWMRVNPPVQSVAIESFPTKWVPWIVEELLRGTPEASIRQTMLQRLPVASVEAMLETAREAARRA